jgi:hypothetical protein
MIFQDSPSRDDPIVRVNVDELPALHVEAVVVTNRWGAIAYTRLVAEGRRDRLEAYCVGPRDQQIEVGFPAEWLGDSDVALPVAVTNARTVEPVDEEAHRMSHYRLSR